MRIVFSIVAGLLSSVFVVVSLSFIISFIYEDEVSGLFLEELNNRVEADLRAGDVNLSLLKKFPNAVVELQSFELNSSKEAERSQEGGLKFTAEEIYFQFDVIDLFTGRYNLDNLYINHSQLNFTPGGKKTPIQLDKQHSGEITLNLKNLIFNDLSYTISNKDQGFSVKGNASRIRLNGNISSSRFELHVDSKSFVDELMFENFPYIHRKSVDLNLDLLVTPKRYTVKAGHIYYENIPFSTQGTLDRQSHVLDLHLKGNGVDIKNFELYLPWEIKKKLEALLIKEGDLDFYALINGPVKNGKPDLQADFSLNKGDMLLNFEDSYRLRNISLSGYISNGRYNSPASSLLTINDLHAELDESILNCNLKLSDFSQPQLSSEGNATLHLESLREYFSHVSIEEPEGAVYMNYEFDGSLESLDHPARIIQNSRFTCDANFDQVVLTNGNYHIAIDNGFAFLDKDIFLDGLYLQVNGNKMELDGKVIGVHRNITDTSEPYHLDLELESPGIDADRLFIGNSNRGDSVVNFRFPRRITGNVAFKTKKFRWKDFDASGMSGILYVDGSGLRLEQLEFNAFDGKTYASAELSESTRVKELLMDSRLYLEHINIYKVFDTFDDFGQDYITARNLRGFIDGEVKLSSSLNKDLSIKKNSLYTLGDIEINNGELVNFDPLIKMANFVSLSELEHVTFSQLTNKITIEDRTVYIPEMDISSSAFDITISGYHSFDNDFSYQVGLLLSQVLSKKARERNDFQSEFGNIQEDGVGRTKLFLKIHGNPEKYAIQYDKEGVRNRMREDLQREKNELKQILNEEFGWFKRDTTLRTEQKKQDGKKFDIQWEEDQSGNSQINEPTDSLSRRKEEFTIEWEHDTLN